MAPGLHTRSAKLRLTIIHPALGRRVGQRYIRSWQMESLPAALLAGLTPDGVDIRFYDDRMEAIPYDQPTDLVAISVETYTARRAYQIASEFRRRRVPVVMGGFHATLCPDEVARFAESVVVGEAEQVWPLLIDDFRHRRMRPRYHGTPRPGLTGLHYDRSIFRGKRYLPIGLVEAGRGCRYRCEFCAVQTVFDARHQRRPVDDIVAELGRLRGSTRLIFFVDDNFAGDRDAARELLQALIPLKLRWVTQLSIDAAHDAGFVELLARAGCKGVLIGFESLDPATLKQMGKGFNSMRGGYDAALQNLARRRVCVYATFVFGYDRDTAETFAAALEFAQQQRFYITAFNHLTPFPGTPLYQRLQQQGRLLYDHWWLDPAYSYNGLPFRPAAMDSTEVQRLCVDTRRRFYSAGSILRRGLAPVNRADGFMFRNFFPINLMHRAEVNIRDHHPLGDAGWHGHLLEV